jgi:threonine dehydrogenase-like Zn-dependent dehydrogenase
VDIAFECTGSPAGLTMAMRLVRAGGIVVVSGMPSGSADLAPLWYRELRLVGAYASSSQHADFAEAIRLAGSTALAGYVDTAYPLGRWREALNHAARAGRLGTVKVAFDLTRR